MKKDVAVRDRPMHEDALHRLLRDAEQLFNSFTDEDSKALFIPLFQKIDRTHSAFVSFPLPPDTSVRFGAGEHIEASALATYLRSKGVNASLLQKQTLIPDGFFSTKLVTTGLTVGDRNVWRRRR